MKKIINIGLVSLVLSASMVAQADTWVANTAKNQRGEETRSDYGGYDSTRVAAAGVAASQVICTGRCILAGLIPSTGAAGSEMRFYDTSVAGLAGNMVVGRLALTTQFPATETNVAYPRVTRPLRFVNGITVQLNSIGAGENVTVLYVDLDQR